MKRTIILLLSFFLSVNIFAGAKTGSLKEVLQPETISVYGNELYVLEKAVIFVYKLKDMTFVRKFGKPGEGPGELKLGPFATNCVTVFKDYLFAETMGKVIFFSKEGKLIKEHKIGRLLKILPLKKNYVVKTFSLSEKDKKTHMAIKLYDSNMKVVKELCGQVVEGAPQRIAMLADALNFFLYEDKIFVEKSHQGLIFEVFDATGKGLYRIDLKAKKIPVTDEYKTAALNSLKEDFQQKKLSFIVPPHIAAEGWEKFTKWATFIYPDYVPPIRDFIVDNGKIYVRTFKRKGEKDEYLIMDLKGNNLRKVFLPAIKNASFVSELLGQGIKHYTISNNKFIYLKEDEETEEWKVMVEEIK